VGRATWLCFRLLRHAAGAVRCICREKRTHARCSAPDGDAL
jgi:hypothetical protein